MPCVGFERLAFFDAQQLEHGHEEAVAFVNGVVVDDRRKSRPVFDAARRVVTTGFRWRPNPSIEENSQWAEALAVGILDLVSYLNGSAISFRRFLLQRLERFPKFSRKICEQKSKRDNNYFLICIGIE